MNEYIANQINKIMLNQNSNTKSSLHAADDISDSSSSNYSNEDINNYQDINLSIKDHKN